MKIILCLMSLYMNTESREEQARRYLGAFLFSGEDVYKQIAGLSGGKKSRLSLKLMLTGANFLVLDEPTNHLDIPAKEAVEEALQLSRVYLMLKDYANARDAANRVITGSGKSGC